jgi:hypothetical protein
LVRPSLKSTFQWVVKRLRTRLSQAMVRVQVWLLRAWVCSDQLTIPPLALLQSHANNGTLRKGSQDAASGRVVESPTTSDSQSSAPSLDTRSWHLHQSFSHIAAGDMAECNVFTLEPHSMVLCPVSKARSVPSQEISNTDKIVNIKHLSHGGLAAEANASRLMCGIPGPWVWVFLQVIIVFILCWILGWVMWLFLRIHVGRLF